jgi:hypothetical protein
MAFDSLERFIDEYEEKTDVAPTINMIKAYIQGAKIKMDEVVKDD